MAVAQTKTLDDLVNGAVYEHCHRRFTLVFIEIEQAPIRPKWGMLHIGRHVEAGMSAPGFQHDESGSYVFSEKELIEKFDRQDWIRLDGRLRIEKIDDMSLVEYSIGNLESIDEMSYNGQ